MNVLFIADPGSIHDLKWMEAMSHYHTCFVLVRHHHRDRVDPKDLERRNLKHLGLVHDFSVRKFIQTLSTARTLTRLIAEHRIDVLHLLYAEPNALWANFSHRFSCKIVLTTRGTDVLKTIPSFARKRSLLAQTVAKLYMKALERCDRITSTSLKQQAALLAFNPRLDASKLVCIRTGIDVDAIDRSAAVQHSKPYVLFPRAMQPIYNHECALSAISKLPEHVRSTYCFVFVDADSSNLPYRTTIEGLMKDLPAEILWLKHLETDALFGWMKSAAACVMTPHSDGTPVSALEALAAGTALLLPDLGYDADLFGDTAYFYTPNDPSDLAVKLQHLLDQPNPAQRRGAAERIKERASRINEMDRLQRLYLSLDAK